MFHDHINVVDVQGVFIHLLGTAKFYLHFLGHVRIIEVAVADGVAKEDEMVLSLHTLKRLGKVQESFPNIDLSKFAEEEPLFSDAGIE